MTRALLVCAAFAPAGAAFYRDLISGAEFVVAADAGALLCLEHGRPPDLIVGDLDSLSSEISDRLRGLGISFLTAPVDKDQTDLDLSLQAVQESGMRHVTVTAAWSDRLDHTLAAIGSVAGVSDLVVDIVDPHMAGWVLNTDTRNSLVLDPEGSTVSLLALTEVAVVSCSGMRYPLERDTLSLLSSRGVSNTLTEDGSQIRLHSGRLLVLSHTVDLAPKARLAPLGE